MSHDDEVSALRAELDTKCRENAELRERIERIKPFEGTTVRKMFDAFEAQSIERDTLKSDNAALRAQLESEKLRPAELEKALRQALEKGRIVADSRDALLREKEERLKPCVWDIDSGDSAFVISCAGDSHHIHDRPPFCPDCGHPVEVKETP